MTIVDTGKNIFFRNRFAILFTLLFCVLLIPPYFENSVWILEFWRVLFTLVLLWALYSIAGTRRVIILAVVILIPTIGSTWLAEPGKEKYLAYLDNLTNILYFGLICTFLAKYILSTRRVTLEIIFASMCLYIILAILWAAIYTNLELYYGAAFSFNGQGAAEAGIGHDNLYRNMIYYSFVTLSTLGYGDILPIHPVALNWAGLEAMIGQFYIAIVMARLVSMHTVQHGKDAVENRQ